MKFSAVAARRAGSASPSNCQTSTPAPNDGCSFPRRHRLTRSLDFQRVIREGKRIRTVHLDVRVLASPLGFPRIGIVVPKHQHSAVDRNRLKRRLRELARVELLPTLRDRAVDLAIRARREAYDAPFVALGRDIARVREQMANAAVPADRSPETPSVG